MNRKLLSGLALISVAGTGGVAYATVAGPEDTMPSTIATTETSAATTTTTAAVGRTIAYQVGDAGTVTLEVAGSGMTSRGLVPAGGWSVGAMSNSGAHIDVQFANTERVVGFTADLVGEDVVVSVTNDRLAGSPGPVDPLVVSVIDGSDAPTPAVAPATGPSLDTVVPATPAPAPVAAPVQVAPPAASTSAPSSVGTSDDDEHEYESNDGDHSNGDGEFEGGDDD